MMDVFDQEWAAQASRNLILQATSGRPLVEFYDGEDLTQWQARKIRIQLYNLLRAYKDTQEDYAKCLERFIQTWEKPENQLDGNNNVEAVNSLISAAGQEAARDWPLQNYFMNLEASLRQVTSSENKLPRLPAEKPGGEMAGPGGMLSKKNVGQEIPSMFGPTKETPEPLGGGAVASKPESPEPVI